MSVPLQVVDEAIRQRVLHGTSSNTLSLGFRKASFETISGASRAEHKLFSAADVVVDQYFKVQAPTGGVEARRQNTTIKYLKEPVWDVLLSRIGKPLMSYLLQHCSVFIPLPNSCYLQVCGRPLNDVSELQMPI